MQDPSSTSVASGYSADAAQTHYIQVGETKIAYRELGSASKTPLVLCMRFRGTMDEWDPALLDALSRDRRVYLFDSAGVGLSSGETPDNIPGMAAIAAAFIRALKIGPVDVLGWSMGGYVAQTLALNDPELVRKVIVAGSGPGGVPDAPSAPPRVWEVAPKPVNEDEDILYLFFPETPEGRGAGQAHLARLGKRVEPPEPVTRPESVKAHMAALSAFRTKDALYPRLEQLTAPVLYANGTQDVMAHAFNSYAAVMRAPNAQLILYSRAGHGFLFQYHEDFCRDVARFLGQ
jgi:pimeloyl-ACP methyl ester carboxylesterase